MPGLSLVLVIHGESGVGKSPIGMTTPAPRLVLDVEGGTTFVAGRKVGWEPLSEAPPAPGEWDTCVVKCRDFQTFARSLEWLKSGAHPFKSVTVDSLSELQKRCKDGLVAPTEVMAERQWGILLTTMEAAVREMRDLRMHPTNPLECVCFLALTDNVKGLWRPMLQGRLAMTLPALVDVVGYVAVRPDETGRMGPAQRSMLVQPDPAIVAKDRTAELANGGISGTFGPWVPGPINIVRMIGALNSEER
jgi:hypothetical protein